MCENLGCLRRNMTTDLIEKPGSVTPINDNYLKNVVFRDLIYFVEEEYGLPMSGPITVPCDPSFMECAVSIVRRHPVKDMDKAGQLGLPMAIVMVMYWQNIRGICDIVDVVVTLKVIAVMRIPVAIIVVVVVYVAILFNFSVMEDGSASYVHGGLAPVANVQNIAIDTKSPFYLHPSDHPGLIFVTQPLSENGENYFTWRRNMLTVLQSKNKAWFVDGLIAKPGVHSGDFQSWIQCNAVVKSWIVNSLSRKLQTGAAHADTTSEIWYDFDERISQGIALRVYDLKRSIALLQQEKSAISTYYGKLKGVWNELHNLRPIPVYTCGAGKKMQEMREEEKVFNFLMGLDDTYKTVQSQIMSIDPLPRLGRAYAVAAQEEKQQVVAAARVPTIEATTLLDKAPHIRHGGDQKIDRRGENSGERRHGRLHCTQCNRSNHSRENCCEIIRYPPGWRRPKPRGRNQPWLRASGGTASSAAIA
ncbi:hypothetical protein RJ639_045683 [Escallonia herrerae]|uniref:Retrotransposon Copia-like N-terminal domain-containing protein n=1 Tax=Escallonia herrerae TaxID=1293975 RepID=A0AA89B0R4_9ASTE|nr:hypothetical protein RJ639_045683 [Escallonia herrerae]